MLVLVAVDIVEEPPTVCEPPVRIHVLSTDAP
jgi:hypothetical protein